MTATRKHYNTRLAALTTERSSFISQYKELSDFIAPRSGRCSTSDRNKGDKRYTKIIQSTATKSWRAYGAGMLSGQSSPSKPWFKLKTPDSEMMEYAAVKE